MMKNGEYKKAIELLYGIAYTIKMMIEDKNVQRMLFR